jgi:signal transduction histidine kinase
MKLPPMKLPLSIHARQIMIALVAGMIALAVSWQANKAVLDIVVSNSLNDKMDAQLAGIEQAIGRDGVLDRSRLLLLPDLQAADGGWGWDVRTIAGHWRFGQRAATTAYAHGTLQRGHGAYSGRGWTRDGTRVHLRQRRSGPAGAPVYVTVIAPDALIKGPIRHALIPTTAALVLLALILAMTALLQIHVGLKPVRRLRAAVAQIRDGSLDRLPGSQPGELAPLAAEINALIAQNEAGLQHARQHLANLAHGLKTPLATLSLIIAGGTDAHGEARNLLASIDSRVAHHLRRARSAAIVGGARLKSDGWQTCTDLLQILQRLNPDTPLRHENLLPNPCDLAVDPEDLGEMLGNLLENAFRHARSHIRVSAQAMERRLVRILVEDDGPGIPDGDFAEALLPGRRLDESGTGYGFGLIIAKEIAELYSGQLALARSERLGGLAVMLDLPPVATQ